MTHYRIRQSRVTKKWYVIKQQSKDVPRWQGEMISLSHKDIPTAMRIVRLDINGWRLELLGAI